MTLCACGCGNNVLPGSRYRRGHNPTGEGLSPMHINGPIHRRQSRNRKVRVDPFVVANGMTYEQMVARHHEQRDRVLAKLRAA